MRFFLNTALYNEYWIECAAYNLKEFAGEIPFIIVGNKLDLEASRQVDTDTAAELAIELNAVEFFETSAKTGKHVENAFLKLATKTFEKYNS